MDDREEYYVMTALAEEGERVTKCWPVWGPEGKLAPPEKHRQLFGEEKLRTLPLRDLPMDALRLLFERNPLALLERLQVGSILRCREDAEPCRTGEELLAELDGEIRAMKKSGDDSPLRQIRVRPVTATLWYNYDFGDDWNVVITASRTGEYLEKAGTVTQARLEKAAAKCRETYRPVTLAADGEMLVDDVGGPGGFAEFLKAINPDPEELYPEDLEEAEREKEEWLAWANGLGWRSLSPWI